MTYTSNTIATAFSKKKNNLRLNVFNLTECGLGNIMGDFFFTIRSGHPGQQRLRQRCDQKAPF
jgi:hypothetical protein